MKKIDIVFNSIFLLFLIVVFLLFFTFGLEISEKQECIKWQEQAEQYPNYYITEWQFLQCKHYDIEINTPVE